MTRRQSEYEVADEAVRILLDLDTWSKASNLAASERRVIARLREIHNQRRPGAGEWTSAQKNAKARLKRKLKASLNDLRRSAEALGWVVSRPPANVRLVPVLKRRFRPKEFEEIFHVEDIAGLVRECTAILGVPFASRVLQELKAPLKSRNVDIVLQQKI